MHVIYCFLIFPYLPSQDTRQPISLKTLTKCISTVCKGYESIHTARTLDAMFILAFFRFLRCSELTITSGFNPNIHPTVSDLVTIDKETISFFIKQSKSDQAKRGHYIYIFNLQSPICPNQTLLAFSQIRKSQASSFADPLFTDDSNRPVTRFWFQKHLKCVLIKSGFPADNFSSHFFRIGAATTAAQNGQSSRSKHSDAGPHRLLSTAFDLTALRLKEPNKPLSKNPSKINSTPTRAHHTTSHNTFLHWQFTRHFLQTPFAYYLDNASTAFAPTGVAQLITHNLLLILNITASATTAPKGDAHFITYHCKRSDHSYRTHTLLLCTTNSAVTTPTGDVHLIIAHHCKRSDRSLGRCTPHYHALLQE